MEPEWIRNGPRTDLLGNYFVGKLSGDSGQLITVYQIEALEDNMKLWSSFLGRGDSGSPRGGLKKIGFELEFDFGFKEHEDSRCPEGF